MNILNWLRKNYYCIKFWLEWKHYKEEGSFARYSNLYMYNCEKYNYILLRHIYHD
jgi:hypothetical protein